MYITKERIYPIFCFYLGNKMHYEQIQPNANESNQIGMNFDPELQALISMFTTVKTIGQQSQLRTHMQIQELPPPSKYKKER